MTQWLCSVRSRHHEEALQGWGVVWPPAFLAAPMVMYSHSSATVSVPITKTETQAGMPVRLLLELSLCPLEAPLCFVNAWRRRSPWTLPGRFERFSNAKLEANCQLSTPLRMSDWTPFPLAGGAR